MSRILNFSKRNLKELLRDPILYVFCLGFPIIMLILFQIINKYTFGNTPMFELKALLPAIIMFSYTFVMLTMSLLVSKDRETFFLKRLYSSPMKSYHFVVGYSSVGIVIGLFQTLICVLSAFIISLISKVDFISFAQVLLLVISQIPILLISVFLGILIGTLLNDKSAPGVCSIFISLSGVLGGCWMPIESMGGFEVFCTYLPFYPSVYLGRIITKATNVFNNLYIFDKQSVVGLILIFVYMLCCIIASFIIFNKKMVSD